jgi:hypothetical protein
MTEWLLAYRCECRRKYLVDLVFDGAVFNEQRPLVARAQPVIAVVHMPNEGILFIFIFTRKLVKSD